jgi:flagellar protein FliO/FliZ
MSKSILLSRAVAQATAALGACLLAFAGPASAFTAALKTAGGSGENTPLDLNTSTGAAPASATSTGGASIVRTIVGLAIVIAVIWGLAWILRQVKAHRESGPDSGQPSAGLASVAALTLGSGRSVHLVRAGNDYVLLGATEHGVAPIHRYSEHEARDAGLLGEFDSLPEQPRERSRLLSTASQLLLGAGRVVEPRALPSAGGRTPVTSAGGRAPITGPRPNPMHMPSPASGLVERLRELTVRH